MQTAVPDLTRDAQATLSRNLKALSRSSPLTVERILAATSHPGVEFVTTDQPDCLSATLDGRSLASRRRPLDEADRIADRVDLKSKGCVLVLGFALGFHVASLAKRIGRDGLIIVFEPDIALLRAVLERIDHSQWLENSNVAILTDASDSASMSTVTNGVEGILAMGVEIVEHPPSRSRLGEKAGEFADRFSAIVAAVRTVVVTAMVQMEVTIRNLLMNIDHYTNGAGVTDLAGAMQGVPAIIVSAGPSLRRNIELLKTPGLRDRCVIIAVQTTLKTLLSIGVKPHFVTALDYHEISKRFYEGLTPEDVQGVTLVAEPEANPVILDSFPGAIRCPSDSILDTLLGEELAGVHGELTRSATVAHLAHYLARRLGCDPVIFIGQDLGFTDGQYYAKGAAIHDVWAPELNPFNTLEMMELERILRSRATLREVKDHAGRPMHTDEQMATYLAQFERDFLADSQKGLTIIDATEGGVAKARTTVMTLAEAIEQYIPPDAEPRAVPGFEKAPVHNAKRAKTLDRLSAVRRDTGKIHSLSRQTQRLLDRMLKHQSDQRLVGKLIQDVNDLRDKVQRYEPAYSLVHRLNQTGGFNRARADRVMRLSESLTGLELQRAQIQRDMENVRWFADAAESFSALLDDAVATLNGAPKRTRDPAPDEVDSPDRQMKNIAAPTSVPAIIAVNPDRSSFGIARDLSSPFCGRSTLSATIHRLASAQRISRIIITTHEPDRIRSLISADAKQGVDVEVIRSEAPSSSRRADAIRAARLWARTCWRGGLGSMTCFDEALDPAATLAVMQRENIAGALIVGPDWPLVDPALCDAVIERFLESPTRHRLTFTQAPPGLAGCVIERSLLDELVSAERNGSHFASAGGLLGYIPINPKKDAIGEAVCAPTSATVRSAMARFIADSDQRLTEMRSAAQRLGPDADADAIARDCIEGASSRRTVAPEHTILELCAARASKRRLDPSAPSQHVNRTPLSMKTADRIFTDLTAARSDAAITLAGFGDPLLHERCVEIIRLAKDRGIAGVHLRTDLIVEPGVIDDLLASGVDVISVNLMAGDAAAYKNIMGVDAFDRVLGALERLYSARRKDGLPHPWLAVRITRCDASYEQIEPFFDKWRLLTGAAVIDQLPAPMPGDRIEPLGKPPLIAERDWRSRMMILCDGAVIADERDAQGERSAGNLKEQSLTSLWRQLQDRRQRAFEAHGHSHPDLWTGW